MRIVLLLPIGVTRETVHGILGALKDGISGVVTVTTPGFNEVKSRILEGVRAACELMGAEYRHLEVGLGDREASAKIYSVIRELRPDQVIVSWVTGSRYLYPVILQAMLRYWYETKCSILMVHGVEGGEWQLQPLIGFLTYELDEGQLRIFKLIYEDPRDSLRTKEDLIDRHSFKRTIYKTLRKLEEKGLIVHRRNRIEKTLPGYLLYNLLKEAGEI